MAKRNEPRKLWYVYVHPNLEILPQIETGEINMEFTNSYSVRVDGHWLLGHWEKNDKKLCFSRERAVERLCVEMRKRIRELQRVTRKAESILKRMSR